MRYYESNGENRTSYWTLQRGSESLCGISANFWSWVQGNRKRYNTSKETSFSKKGYDNVNNKDYGGRDALIIIFVLYTLGYKYLFFLLR